MAGLLSSGLRKVAGNLAASAAAGPRISNKIPAFANVEFGIGSKGKNKTKNLAYPLNVESDVGQGHYIIFEVMKQDKAKLTALKAVKEAGAMLKNIAKQNGQNKTENVVTDSKDLKPQPGNKQSGPNSLQVAQKATKAMPVCIALYMPPSVQVQYGVKYNEQEIGVLSETGNAAIQAFMGGGATPSMTEVGIGALKAAGSGLFNKLKEKAPAGTAAVFAINTGSIITPRMELMFEGILRRTFSFNFTFLPKSEQEADIVEQIVHKFKYHMASNYGGLGLGGVDGVREMEIPDFFQIVYKYQGKENSHLNKIKKCVLTNATVEYGADQYKSYAGGRPQTTKLNLSFQELEIITKDYIKQGY